jgi:hypothetical protein
VAKNAQRVWAKMDRVGGEREVVRGAEDEVKTGATLLRKTPRAQLRDLWWERDLELGDGRSSSSLAPHHLDSVVQATHGKVRSPPTMLRRLTAGSEAKTRPSSGPVSCTARRDLC